jgi:type III secretion protein U
MSEKTEQPTHHRLRKAREEGQVARSKDVTQAVMALALFTYLFVSASEMRVRLQNMIVLPEKVLGLNFDVALGLLLSQYTDDLIALLMPSIGIVVGVGLFIEALQTGMLVAPKAATPSWKKLNVIENVKQIFSMKNAMEFVKSLVKICLLTALVAYVVMQALSPLLTLPQGGIGAVLSTIYTLLQVLVIFTVSGQVVIAAVDFLWQKRHHIHTLRMTKDEVKREHHDDEGDPHFKSHRKKLHKEMSSGGPANKARKATALVVNPIHVAIALRYVPNETPLPLVLAKAQGELALHLQALARQQHIPIIENIALAWNLMELADEGQYIPEALIPSVGLALRLANAVNPDEDEDL